MDTKLAASETEPEVASVVVETVVQEVPAPVSVPEIALARIDLNALWVVRRLRAKGFDAYLTGGCVRDLLLGKTPKDFDVATSAKPEELKQVFRNCRLIGRRFLLAHIFFPGGKVIETATFRANPIDIQEDLPEDLLVTRDNVYGNIEEDAKRRDLTINGLFYDPVEGKVIDYVGGREDLEAGIVRTIGVPDIRFQEDPVRILRAIKFAARLGFRFEDETLAAMKKHTGEISRCAPARVQEELMRLLTSKHASIALVLCREVGILQTLMPELVEMLECEMLPEVAKEAGDVSEVVPTVVATPAEREALLLGMLRGLDAVCEREANVNAAVAFASILLPAYLALEKSAQNERNWIDRLCVTWSERIRLARRDQDRIRLLLSAVRMFIDGDVAGNSAQFLVRKSWFRESLLLYIVYLVAKDEPLDKVDVWKSLAQSSGRLYRQDRHGQRLMQPRFRKRRPQSRMRMNNKRQVA